MKQKLVVVGNGMAGARAVGRGPRPRAGSLRHRDVRRRALRQLQPHPAVEHPQRRPGHERDLHQSARLVRGERHQAPCRRAGPRDRPCGEGRAVRGRGARTLRQAPDRDRQPRLHPADGGHQRAGRQAQARRVRLPHHRRLQRHRSQGEGEPPRRRDRRRAARPRSRARASSTTAARSTSCTSPGISWRCSSIRPAARSCARACRRWGSTSICRS